MSKQHQLYQKDAWIKVRVIQGPNVNGLMIVHLINHKGERTLFPFPHTELPIYIRPEDLTLEMGKKGE